VFGEGECNFNLGHCWDDTDRGKLSVQNNPSSAPNCPLEFPHGMIWEPDIRGERATCYGLRNDTALNFTELLVAGRLE
jgi:hypothetical protein